jgi:hypothetical protein
MLGRKLASERRRTSGSALGDEAGRAAARLASDCGLSERKMAFGPAVAGSSSATIGGGGDEDEATGAAVSVEGMSETGRSRRRGASECVWRRSSCEVVIQPLRAETKQSKVGGRALVSR